MNDLLALLEDLADDARPQAMPDAASLRNRAERHSRRTQLGWAALAAAAVAAVAIGTVASHPKAADEPASPPGRTETTLPDRFIAPSGPPTWTTDLSEGGRFAVNALAYHAGTWLALGESAQGKGTGEHSVGWVSHDGRHWSRTPVPDGLGHNADGVVGTADGFLAAGTHGGWPYAWTSRDGLTWSRTDLTGNSNNYQPYATSKGLFVAGLADLHGTDLWRSTDHGKTWMVVDDNLKFALGPASADWHWEDLMPIVEWIGEKDGTLVAGGTGYSVPGERARAALVYTSTDGEHWTEQVRAFTSFHDRATWAGWAGGYRSTHDEDHYATVRGDGQVAVWQPPDK